MNLCRIMVINNQAMQPNRECSSQTIHKFSLNVFRKDLKIFDDKLAIRTIIHLGDSQMLSVLPISDRPAELHEGRCKFWRKVLNIQRAGQFGAEILLFKPAFCKKLFRIGRSISNIEIDDILVFVVSSINERVINFDLYIL